jgi:hypothetical protein
MRDGPASDAPIHSRWAKEGDAIFDLRDRGGRHHQHLSLKQEVEVLAPFIAKADAGGMLKVAPIQRAYEQRIGKAVAPSTVDRRPSTVYRLPAAGATRLAQGGSAPASPEDAM